MSYRPDFIIEVVILFKILIMWKTYSEHRNFSDYQTPYFENKHMNLRISDVIGQ